jgi:hypothetical protein
VKNRTRKKTDAQKKKILWKLFSEYIRSKDSKDGYNICFTCGVKKEWKMMHAGHYIRASAGLATYFDEQNVHPQCYACNIWRDGNSDMYALKLIEKYGDDILNELNRRKQKIIKDFPFEEKINYYEQLLKSKT